MYFLIKVSLGDTSLLEVKDIQIVKIKIADSRKLVFFITLIWSSSFKFGV